MNRDTTNLCPIFPVTIKGCCMSYNMGNRSKKNITANYKGQYIIRAKGSNSLTCNTRGIEPFPLLGYW